MNTKQKFFFILASIMLCLNISTLSYANPTRNNNIPFQVSTRSTDSIAPTAEDTNVYKFVNEMPEFPGGNNSIGTFLAKEIKFPEDAKEKGVYGIVLIEFVVEKNGLVSNVRLKVPLYPSCDSEAVRAVKAMPKWKPGIQNGKPVRCYFNIPIRYDQSLNDNGSNAPLIKKTHQRPEFPGGIDSLNAYITKESKFTNINLEEAKEDYVTATFIVDTDRSINHISIIKKSENSEKNWEAIRIIQNMPKWKPAYQKGAPVRYLYQLTLYNRKNQK